MDKELDIQSSTDTITEQMPPLSENAPQQAPQNTAIDSELSEDTDGNTNKAADKNSIENMGENADEKTNAPTAESQNPITTPRLDDRILSFMEDLLLPKAEQQEQKN